MGSVEEFARSFAEHRYEDRRAAFAPVRQPVSVVCFHSDLDAEQMRNFQNKWESCLHVDLENTFHFYDAGFSETDCLMQACETFRMEYLALNSTLYLYVILDPGCRYTDILGGVQAAAQFIRDRGMMMQVSLIIRVSELQSGSKDCLCCVAQIQQALRNDISDQSVRINCYAVGRSLEKGEKLGSFKWTFRELDTILDIVIMECSAIPIFNHSFGSFRSDLVNHTQVSLRFVSSLHMSSYLETAYKVGFDTFSDACINRLRDGDGQASRSPESISTPYDDCMQDLDMRMNRYIEKLKDGAKYLIHTPYDGGILTSITQSEQFDQTYYSGGLLKAYFKINLERESMQKSSDAEWISSEKISAYLMNLIDQNGLEPTINRINDEIQKSMDPGKAKDGFNVHNPVETTLRYYAETYLVEIRRRASRQYVKLLQESLKQLQTLNKKLKCLQEKTQSARDSAQNFQFFTKVEQDVQEQLNNYPYSLRKLREAIIREDRSFLESIRSLFESDTQILGMIPEGLGYLETQDTTILNEIQEQIRNGLLKNRRCRIRPTDSYSVYAITNDENKHTAIFERMNITHGAKLNSNVPCLTVIEILDIQDVSDIMLNN